MLLEVGGKRRERQVFSYCSESEKVNQQWYRKISEGSLEISDHN